jgi:CheY-like chemotaxis protein
MKKHILMIDDDLFMMEVYETALKESQFEVTRFSGENCVAQGVHFLEEKASSVDLVIVDIMMPPGKTLKDQDTNQGMKAGVVLLEMLKVKYPNLPLLGLTNMNRERLEQIQNMVPWTRILQKAHCPPFKLVKIIQETTKQAKVI